jgi:Xaa-Pro aminopeptidase
MTHWILAGLGLLLALLAPRWKYVNLMGFAGLLGLLLGTGLLLMLKPGIAAMAAGVGAALLLALLLTRLTPRLILLLLLFVALAGSLGPRWDHASSLGRWSGLAAALLLLAFGVIKTRSGLRLVWALLGATLIVPRGEMFPLWCGALALLLLANYFTTRNAPLEPPSWKRTFAIGLLLALILAAAILWAARSAIVAGAAEKTALTHQLPQGRHGLIWILPSESITWGDPAYPWFDNLDALYALPDSPGITARRLVALPGTTLLSGRFELNSDIHKLRRIKSADEIKALQTASGAIVAALKETLPLIHDGGGEGAVAKSVQARQLTHGCEADSFPPIVAAGAHALDFHYMKNNGALKSGELLVIDIGCYTKHYASDFTRTLPVGGKFSERQRKIYGAVYDSQQAAAAMCRPGVWLSTPRSLLDRMGGRDPLEGVSDGKLAPGEFAPGKFSLDKRVRDMMKERGVPGNFAHGVGHPLGLFVHDVFDWSAPLQPGMVIMIEPGLYLKDEKTGIRLEDAYLVTKDGCELLTTGFPADPDSIEKMMAELGPGA